jgi:hypothetical protein
LPLTGKKPITCITFLARSLPGAKECDGLCVAWALLKPIRPPQFAFLGWLGDEQLTL